MTTWQDYAGIAGAAVTTWNYDGYRGFMTNKAYATASGPSYTYTKAGHLGTRTWARGITTTYSYNNAGELALVDYSDSTPDVSYSYNRQGRPSQITGATSNDFTYSAAGLLLSENAVNKSWNYASQVRLGYDALQRRTGLTNLSLGLKHAYAYDAASRLQSVSTLDSGAPSVISYNYVSNSPLVGGLTYQQNGTTRLTVSQAYDNLNRLRQINSVTNAQSVASFAYAYNAANQRTAVTNVDGSRWAYGYDRLGQVTNGWRYWSDGSDVLGQTFNYAFDDIGNRKSAGSGTPGTQRMQSYQANLLNQYTNRTVPGYVEVNGSADAAAAVTVNGGAVSRQSEYYRQEATVNNSSGAVVQWLTSRATNTVGTSVVARLSFTAQTPELSTYDGDGNLTQDGLWTYTWDGENRLTRIQTRTNAITDSNYWQQIDCTYDQQSRRVRKQVSRWGAAGWVTISAQRFFYDSWNLVGQLDEVTGIRLSFVWSLDLGGSPQGAGGVGGLKALIVHTGASAGTYFYSYDGNGNVAALVNAADGTEAARYEYGPFLELLRATGPLARLNPFRASTKYQDDEADLLYYGYRYLSTVTGRWLSRDPSTEAVGGLNLHAFVRNSAVDRSDFRGLWDQGIHYGIILKWMENRNPPANYAYYKWNCFHINVISKLFEGNDIVDGTGNYPSTSQAIRAGLEAQSTENAYKHAMRVPGQPVWEAQRLYVNFVRYELNEAFTHARKAKGLFKSNPSPENKEARDELEEAIVHIGKAQHPVADSTSPAHRGFQIWIGPEAAFGTLAEAGIDESEIGISGAAQVRTVVYGSLAYGTFITWHISRETQQIYSQYRTETIQKVMNVSDDALTDILKE